MLSIFRKELRVFFNSLIAYVVIGVFLLLTGLMFWLYPGSNILDFGFADMTSFFTLCPYVFLFLVPAVSMKMFSEEFKSGTIELLFTKPLSSFQIVLGKFLATLVIVLIALLPTLIYYFSLRILGNPEGNIDTAAVIGSYFGLVFLAGSFVAIGIFASTLTNNQIIAFVLAAIISYFFYDGITQFSGLLSGSLGYLFSNIGLSFHFESLSRGVIDSRDIIYFLSFIVIFLLLATRVLDKKRG
jgi:ABC-2 type transport system permease protein